LGSSIDLLPKPPAGDNHLTSSQKEIQAKNFKDIHNLRNAQWGHRNLTTMDLATFDDARKKMERCIQTCTQDAERRAALMKELEGCLDIKGGNIDIDSAVRKQVEDLQKEIMEEKQQRSEVVSSHTSIVVLFSVKFLRSGLNGGIAPMVFIYCLELGFEKVLIGVLLTGILLGDAVISLCLTNSADRIGRCRVLVIGSLLKFAAGVTFALSTDFYMLLVAGALGIVSLSGGECGPFLSIEKAILAGAYEQYKGDVPMHSSVAERRSHETDVADGLVSLLGWLSIVGYVAQAGGALLSENY
jgi:hypothetical protein